VNPIDNAQESFSVVRIDSDFTFDDKMVHEFFFVSDSSTQIMIRRYQNLQDLLAILGGISSTYLLIANFFLTNYKKFLIITTILNNLFTFGKNPKGRTLKMKKKKINEKKIESNPNFFPVSSFRLHKKSKPTKQSITNSMEIIDPNKTNIIMTEIQSQKDIKSSRYVPNEKNEKLSPKFRQSLNFSTKKLQLSSIKKREYPLKFYYFTFIRYQIKKIFKISLNKEEELFDIGAHSYFSEMDFLSILKKLKEISKLKAIVFEPFQKTIE